MSKSLEERKFELSDKFHDNAFKVSTELTKLLLSLSTGVLAAFYFLLIKQNKEGEIKFTETESLILVGSIVFFSLSILFSIRFMQLNSQRYYYLGNIADPLQEYKREGYILKKKRINKFYKIFKWLSGICFGLAILFSSILLIFMTFNN